MKKIIPLLLLSVLISFTFPSREYLLNGNELVLPSPITFNFVNNEYEPTPESDSALNYIKNYLTDKTFITNLRIEAHTNLSSDDEFADILKTRRKSLAIGRWLVKNGIDCKRITCVCFGASKPIADNETPEGRALNDRIQVFNAEFRKVRVGGLPLDGGGKIAGDLCKP